MQQDTSHHQQRTAQAPIDDSNPNYDIVNRIFENAGNSTQTGVEVLLEQEIGATPLLFPTRHPFALAASEDDTWDVTLNNQIQLPGAFELQVSVIYYAERNVPQGKERSRSSVDFAASRPILNERAELLFIFTDIFNDFAVEREIDGHGFTALYQNFLETQVATLGLRVRF